MWTWLYYYVANTFQILIRRWNHIDFFRIWRFSIKIKNVRERDGPSWLSRFRPAVFHCKGDSGKTYNPRSSLNFQSMSNMVRSCSCSSSAEKKCSSDIFMASIRGSYIGSIRILQWLLHLRWVSCLSSLTVHFNFLMFYRINLI